MNGVLHVVEALDPAVHVTRRAAGEQAAAREFVRDWRLADLEQADRRPDLSKIGEKYRGRDLLLHVLEPSREILEGYASHYIVLADGGDVAGRIVADDGEVLHVLPDLQFPDAVVTAHRDEIEARSEMRLSAMPAGLLVTLEEEEVLDLLAYLQSLRD